MKKRKSVKKKTSVEPKQAVKPRQAVKPLFIFNTPGKGAGETEYENKVLQICSVNEYPLTFKDGEVGGKVPDFINRDKKKIVEVYNPARSDEEVYARMKAFHTKAFKVRQLVKHDFTRFDWGSFCTGIIGRFLRD